MKKIFYVLIAMLTFASCQQSTNNKTAKQKKVVKNKIAKKQTLLNPQAFKAKMDATPRKQIIDLRTHGELHRIGPIPGARQVDFQNPNFDKIIANYNKDADTFIYCASGTRSAAAFKKMKALGFKTVYDLQGGVNAWKSAGLPIQAHHH